MSFLKRHPIFLTAILTLLAVAAYEAYWLHGLYTSQKQALTTQISSLLTEAEGYEYAEKLRKSLESDTTVLYTPSPNPKGQVISIGMDTLKGKPKKPERYSSPVISISAGWTNSSRSPWTPSDCLCPTSYVSYATDKRLIPSVQQGTGLRRTTRSSPLFPISTQVPTNSAPRPSPHTFSGEWQAYWPCRRASC